MHALVSIIIPTYNRAYLIGETLDAVLAQTYQNWECLVVDDGSTDATKKIVAKYTRNDARFKYFVRPPHTPKGANACRNYGYEQSTGDHIQWFDSDDIMHPKKLELKVKYAIAQNADVVVDTHTTETNVVLPENPKVEVFTSADFYIDYTLGKRPVITNDVMVKRAVVGAHRFDENLHKAQEYEFFTRLFRQKLTYCFVNIPLTYYRVSDESISKSNSKGNPAQVESLIYLSKVLQKRHRNNPRIVAKAERQGRKTYKSLAQRRNLKMIFKHFNFFRKAHHTSVGVFALYLVYNVVTGRGFDRIKPKKAS